MYLGVCIGTTILASIIAALIGGYGISITESTAYPTGIPELRAGILPPFLMMMTLSVIHMKWIILAITPEFFAPTLPFQNLYLIKVKHEILLVFRYPCLCP